MAAHAAARPGLSESGRVWLLVGTCASSFLSLLIGLALGPFLPEIARDLDAPVALLGQVPALIAAGAAVLVSWLLWPSGRLRRRDGTRGGARPRPGLR
ncbi:MAG TPA: hypothetical protein VGM69_21430 [Chloroflexota bacterium]|jgi:predicted MFS family arabinose efflux permease